MLHHLGPGGWVDVPCEPAVRADPKRGLQLVGDRHRLAGLVDLGGLRRKGLLQTERCTGGRLADERRVMGRRSSALRRHQVRLPVALALVEAGAEVLIDDLLVRGVELIGADLERVAVAPGGAVRPVLGRARRVVELPAVDVAVAVLRRHPRSEALHRTLVHRLTRRADAREDAVQGCRTCGW